MKLHEMKTTILKAGFLPFYIQNGSPIFLFMVSSNPKYGGTKPMISKGYVEIGEDIEDAAIREAQEELGLKKSNLFSLFRVWHGQVHGLKEYYNLSI